MQTYLVRVDSLKCCLYLRLQPTAHVQSSLVATLARPPVLGRLGSTDWALQTSGRVRNFPQHHSTTVEASPPRH